MLEAYKSLRELKVQHKDKLVTVKPGEFVDVSSWEDRVVRTHLSQGLIEKTFLEETYHSTSPTKKSNRAKGVETAPV